MVSEGNDNDDDDDEDDKCQKEQNSIIFAISIRVYIYIRSRLYLYIYIQQAKCSKNELRRNLTSSRTSILLISSGGVQVRFVSLKV